MPALKRKDEASPEADVPSVSVVIPVYNDAERLVRCLTALERQAYPQQAYEVVVVDNGSEKPIAPVVAPFRQARVVVERRRGSYAARNRGVHEAKGGIIAFTDADCIPEATWLAHGVQRLTEGENCGLVGGRIDLFYKDPERPTAAELYDSERFLNQERIVKRGNFAATANAFTFRWMFDEVGFFDPGMKSGGDNEWGGRVYAAGYACCYAEEAAVAHPARHTYSAVREKVLRVLEGAFQLKSRRGYPFLEFCEDVIRDLGHPLKFLLRTAHNTRLSGFSGKATMLVAFPVQGVLCAAKRIRLWLAQRGS